MIFFRPDIFLLPFGVTLAPVCAGFFLYHIYVCVHSWNKSQFNSIQFIVRAARVGCEEHFCKKVIPSSSIQGQIFTDTQYTNILAYTHSSFNHANAQLFQWYPLEDQGEKGGRGEKLGEKNAILKYVEVFSRQQRKRNANQA